MIRFDIVYYIKSYLIIMEVIIIEEIYIWLSLLHNFEYITYLSLIKVFESSKNLYALSKERNKFDNVLIQNKLNLNEKLKSDILNLNLKLKSKEIYKSLKTQNIQIIPFNSKLYPNNLKKLFSPPICIFVKGDIELLKRNKIYIYEEDISSNNAKIIKNVICNKFLNCKKSIIVNENLNIKALRLEDDHGNLNKYINLDCILNIMYNTNNTRENEIKNIEILSAIVDLLVIPEAKYTKKSALLVDSMIENSKEIVVFPNSIFNKNAYFSNYLIKNGANMITNINELKDIIDKM